MVSKQVARQLDLAESTIKEHLKRIRGKYAALGRPVKTRIELLQRAVEDGYVDATVPRGQVAAADHRQPSRSPNRSPCSSTRASTSSKRSCSSASSSSAPSSTSSQVRGAATYGVSVPRSE